MSLFITLILSQLACPGGACKPSPVSWRTRPDDPGRAYLFVEGKQRGGYDRARDEWRDFDPATQSWGEPRRLFSEPDAPNFGVMRDRLAGGERFSLGGVPIERTEAFSALSALPDDSRLPHLTIIGNADDRRAVADDLAHHPALAPWRDRLRVQSYDPDHWAVANLGFVNTGSPTIYLQAPGGRVLHRQDEYRGPERLAGALRKADANYRPDADADLDPTPARVHIPRGAWVGLAALSLFLISRRRNP